MTNLEKAKAITEIAKELDKIADRLYEECGFPPFKGEVCVPDKNNYKKATEDDLFNSYDEVKE